MKVIRLQWVICALITILFAASGRCAEFNDSMRSEDKRLETKVSIVAQRILLGALLDQLTKQTGVDLKIADRDEASGVTLCVFCEQTPLGDVMSALWSLVSYRSALWKWDRSEQKRGFAYELIETRAAKGFPSRLKQQSLEAFQAHAAMMLTQSRLPPQERKKNLDKIADALLQKDTKQAENLLDNSFIWASLSVFDKALSADEQTRALAGGQSSIAIDQMSPEAQSAFRAAWETLHPLKNLPDGTQTPYPLPTRLQFHPGHSPRKESTPSLFMDLGDLGAMSFLGGNMLKEGLRGSLRNQWMLPGDNAGNAAEKQVCREKDKLEPVPTLPVSPDDPSVSSPPGKLPALNFKQPITRIRFGELSKSAPLSLIAILPDDVIFDPGPPYGRTVQQFLQRAIGPNSEFMIKWRHNILLVSYPTWHLYTDERFPYSISKQLQQEEQQGFVPARALADVCARLTDTQWHSLCAATSLLTPMEGARSLLIFCNQNPGVTSAKGVVITEERKDFFLNNLSLSDARMFHDGNAIAVRVVPVQRRADLYLLQEMQFQFQALDRKWRPFIGYIQEHLLPPDAK